MSRPSAGPSTTSGCRPRGASFRSSGSLSAARPAPTAKKSPGTRVRLKLQEIVDNEDKTKPLSDDALVEELAKHGIKVARRTVTKYRKAMDIPSSRQRRDWTEAK